MKRKATGRPKLSKTSPTINVGFKVTEELWAKVMALAEKREVTYSDIIREGINYVLAKKETL
jgi:hypothetical protein